MTHPYSIFIYYPSTGRDGGGHWEEVAQIHTAEYTNYLANLIYNDSKCVMRVVRYGLDMTCFPNKETVERIDKLIASRWPDNILFSRPR